MGVFLGGFLSRGFRRAPGLRLGVRSLGRVLAGPVQLRFLSNERYREWLARARAMRRAQGPLLTQTYAPDPTSGRLRNANDLRFAELSKDARSFEDRIAAAHAMLRAEGMILQSIFPDKADPYSASETVVAFRYERFSTLRLFLLCVTNCKDRAAVSFYRVADPGEPPLTELRGREEDWPSHRKLPNRTSWSFTPGPELKTPFLDPAPPRHPHSRPPTPSPEWLGLLPMSEIP